MEDFHKMILKLIWQVHNNQFFLMKYNKRSFLRLDVFSVTLFLIKKKKNKYYDVEETAQS